MSKEEAKALLLKDAICWQHNAANEYKLAREQREMYLDGRGANLDRYKTHMMYGQSFQRQAMIIIIAVI